MPKAKAIASLSGMIDSDMEETQDIVMMPTPDSNQENVDELKKRAGRPKAAPKPRKVKAIARRLSGGGKAKAPVKKKTISKRDPLKEQANEADLADMQELDDLGNDKHDFVDAQNAEMLAEEPLVQETVKKAPTKRGMLTTKAKQPPKDITTESLKETLNDGEFEYTPTNARQGNRRERTRKGKQLEDVETSEKVVPETQHAPMDLDSPLASSDRKESEEPIPQSVYRQVSHARASSKQRNPLVARRRAESASDTERAGKDPATRRKLGELTKELESLKLKYQNLREVGVKEAEANFDKLKKQSEDKTKTANALIAALKKDLATQTALASEATSLRSTLTTTSTALSSAQDQITQLSHSLAEAANENKALSAKLAASRAVSATVESVSTFSKTPGSALKGKTPAAGRTIMVGSAEAAQAAQVAQLKEDLYSDLTGLILRGVDRQEEADVYDCIQTGRNGTLHFLLAVATDTTNNISYEDTEFTYTPRLDSNRDRDLLDILPEYLHDEIGFSRMNAAKFYSRVVDTLTKKRED